MESLIWSIVFLAVFATLLIVGVTLFLYVRAESSLQRQSAETAKLIEQVTTLSLQSAEQHRSAIEDVLERATTSQSELLDAVTTRMETATELAQKSMDLTLTRALDGLVRTTTHVTTVLQASTALLRTNDTVAFSHVMSAATPAEQSSEPYPGMDEAEEARLVKEQEASLARASAAIRLLEGMGVTDGDAGSR